MGNKIGNWGLIMGCLVILLSACGSSAVIEVGCSVNDLVQAINSANDDIDPTTIILDEECLYNLVSADNDIDYQEEFTGESGSTGLPPISTPITIEGNQATIQRLDTAPEMRFFFITSTGELNLDEVTLNNGLVESGQVQQRNGGSIYNRGVLNLSESHILESYAEDSGGGIFNADVGVLFVENSSVSFNQAGRYGGAVFNGGSLDITGFSIINNNRAVTASGGAIYNTGSVSISGSHINSNRAIVRGGAIAGENGSFLSLDGVLFEENTVGGNGGGALNLVESTFMITDSTFNRNQAAESNSNGGAILISGSEGVVDGGTSFFENSASGDGGAVYIIGDSEVVLDMITFQSNTAGLRGGGLSNYSFSLTVEVRNTTFSGNYAVNGGGIANGGEISVHKSLISANSSTEAGAGIYNSGSLFKLTNSTISGNFNQNFGGGILNYGSIQISYSTVAFNQSMHGAGLYDNGDNVQIKNTIISNNSPYNCSVFGPMTVFGDNLDNDGSCQSFNITTNPFLEPLAANGGPTRTHGFQFNSPAVDGVTDCTDFAGSSMMTLDQRSYLRPFNSLCDLGAYEAMETPPAFQTVVEVNVEIINCLAGPSLEFDLVSNYLFGEDLNVIGRDRGGSWLAVIDPDGPQDTVFCWAPSDSVRSAMPFLAFPVLVASDQPVGSSSSGQETSRCDLFAPEAYSFTQLDIPYGTGDLTMYVTMPGGVPGLEVEVPNDIHPWIYSANLGQYQDQRCTFDGYPDRLYCRFAVPEDYFGTVRDFSVYVNRCETPIFTNAMVSIFEPREILACTIDLNELDCEAAEGTYSCGASADCTCVCP